MLSIGAYSTAPAACPQLSPARRALSRKPVERCDKQTDRETDAPYRFIDYAPHRPIRMQTASITELIVGL